MIGETSHPIEVKAKDDSMMQCERAEECGKWVTGMLCIAESGGPHSVRNILTAVGCENAGCGGPIFRGGQGGDIGVLATHEPMVGADENRITVEKARAAAELAFKTASLPMSTAFDQDL